MKGRIVLAAQRLRRTGVYALALGAGLVSAWAVREHVQQRIQVLEAQALVPQVSRLVAAYDLPAGTRLDESHLAVREIPEQWASRTSIDPLDLAEVLGATLQAGVANGEPLLRAHLTFSAPVPALASRLKAGQRALTVSPADLGGLGEMLRAGDAIDIYVSFSHRQRELTVPVLQGMRVLAVGSEAEGEDGRAGGSITLAASPDEAMRFVAARQAGALTALLRHRDDVAAVGRVAQSDLASLIGLDPEPKAAPGVAILYGDRLDGQVSGFLQDPAGSGHAGSQEGRP
ncbi:MAG: Flp pilus assembly protein CpaB [Achromobacter sp.]|uniref:Flp pilus assembly protein CpaB n=1 Tax=Achromobacter sp. TaxID=134375 RepID=UPI003D022EDC